MFVLFFAVWLLLSGQFTAESVLFGLIASALMTVFSRKVMGSTVRHDLPLLHKAGPAIRYFGFLLWEMLKSCLSVMKLIYTHPREIHPKLIQFHTDLKTDGGRVLLANSITLTPGTITVYANGAHFCVHAMDDAYGDGIENCPFSQKIKGLEE